MPENQRALHPVLSAAARRARFAEGIHLFNLGDHFAAHEAFEEIWRSSRPEPRELFQGLVQVAAGIHLACQLGRLPAGRRVLARGRQRLARLKPLCCGLELEPLMAAVVRWERWLADPSGEAPPLPQILVGDPGAFG